MPIAFACTCGKAMKAKEAFAGRKVRCPQCEKIVRIPRLEGNLGDVMPSMLRVDVDNGRGRPGRTARPSENRPAKVSFAPTSAMAATVSAPAPEPVLGARPVSHAICPPHVWVDRSLDQQPTPWLPGDEERFQKGITSRREGLSGLEKMVLSLVVCGSAVAGGWYFFGR